MAAAAAAALLCGAGCAAWRGDLDPAHTQYVRQQVRSIAQADLRAGSRQPPKTVEQDIDSVRPRRATGTTRFGDAPPDASTRPFVVPGAVPPTPTVADTRPVDTQPAAATQPATTQPAAATRPTTASVPAAATQPAAVPLGIADLRLNMLRNNLDLAVTALDPQIAREQVSEEEARFDAVIFGGVGYKRQDQPRIDGPYVDFDGPGTDVVKLSEVEQVKEALSADVGIEVPLPTGAKVKLLQTFDDEEKSTGGGKRSAQYLSGLKFSVSQPLLRGAGVDVNVGSIRLARLGEQSAEARAKLTAIRVLALGEKAYWNAYAARRALDVRTQQYNVAYDNLELVRKRVAQGASPAIEIVRAEVGVTARLESLIQAETQSRLQQRELKRVLNDAALDLGADTPIDLVSSPALVKLALDRDALVRAALAGRMEMLDLELNLAADAIRVDLARNQALPLFVLDFEYGVLDRQGSLSSAYQSQWDADHPTFAVGVRGEIPITNEARKARLRRALLGRAQRLATREARELAIRQEVYDAVDVLNQNWQRILAARQSVIVSGVNYEAELRQFAEGLRTMREVLEALTLLGDAQLREVQAVLAYQVSQIDIAFATGTLLGYAGVGLDPLPVPAGTGPAATDDRAGARPN